MSDLLICKCVFYNIKFLKILNCRHWIQNSVFHFLKKIRINNKILSQKKKYTNKIKNFFFYQNLEFASKIKLYFKTKKLKTFEYENKKLVLKKKSFCSQKEIIKKIQNIENIFFPKLISSSQNFFSFHHGKKLMVVMKPLFNIKCIRLKSILIRICYSLFKKINAFELLSLIRMFSCEEDMIFRQIFIDILYFVPKKKFFSLLFPFIRAESSKKSDLLPITLLFFNATIFKQNSLYLYSFELIEILLIVKKFLSNKNPKFFNLSLIILKKLSYVNRLGHIPTAYELIYVIFNCFKNKNHSISNYFLTNLKQLFTKFRFLNNPDLVFDFLKLIENSFDSKIFVKKSRSLSVFANILPKKQGIKREILDFFSYCKTKLWISYEKEEIRNWGKLNLMFLKNLIIIAGNTRFEKFIKFECFAKFLRKDMSTMEFLNFFFKKNYIEIFFNSQKTPLEFFKLIFLTINKCSLRISNGINLLKRTFRALRQLLVKLDLKTKPFLPQVSGLLKWGLLNINSNVQKYTSKFVVKCIPIFFYLKEKILVGYLGTILVNGLNNKSTKIQDYFFKTLYQIVKIFPDGYCIPPIQEIFSRIYPVIKNNKIRLKSGLIRLLSLIIVKKTPFIPKKDLILLCSVLIKIQKELKIENRKISLEIIIQISRIHGPSEIIDFLIDSLEKSKGIFRISIIITIATLAYKQNLNIILPKFYLQYLTPKIYSISNVMKGLIYILENVENFKLLNYGNSLGIILESEMIIKREGNNPLLFLLIGKFIEKFQFSGLEAKLALIFRFLIVNFLKSSGLILRYLFFALEKLLLILNPIFWWKPLFHGLIHKKRKIRVLYKKLQKLVDVKQNIWFYFLKLLKNSKRNLFSDNHYLI